MTRASIAVLLLAFLFISAEGARAAQKPPDVFGWDKLKWGMTGDEIKAAYGKEIKVHKAREDASEGVFSNLELTGISIGGEPFRASLWMGTGTKKLSKIVFVPRGEPEGYAWAGTFIKVEEYLVSMYGDPDQEETSNDPGTSAERKWAFPSTTIELSYLRIEGTELLLLVFSEIPKS
ncbi:MAG: hypothetical protein AB1598_05470 [Thermodesulfobacteriota bacterium]